MMQRKIAMAAVDCYALDSAVMVAAGMVDRGGIDFSLETAACKVFGSELAFRTANDALQIAGGIGYSKEYPYEQAVRDSRINLIFEGTNEILRALIALMGMQQPGERLKALGKAFKDPIHSLGAIGDYLTGRAKRTITKPHFSRVHESLEHEAELVSTLVHDLALGVEAAVMKYGKGIIDMQFLQERMANAAIDIFLATAVLSRTTWEIERAGSAAACRRRAHRLRADLRADGVSPRAPVDPRPAPKSGRPAQGGGRAFDGNRRAGTRGARRRTVKRGASVVDFPISFSRERRSASTGGRSTGRATCPTARRRRCPCHRAE